jgi:dTMP kinase
MSAERVETLTQWVCSGCIPARTYWFDVDPAEAQRRREADRAADRFEAEQLAFFARVRTGYEQRFEADPARVVRVDSARTIDEIRSDMAEDLARLLAG